MLRNHLSQNTTMEVNGLKCTLNMPKAVERVRNADGSEGVAGLPPYNQRSAYPVDEYQDSPDSWMRGSATEGSYFVPIEPEHGMWLDFQANMGHSHHVAAVVSVQGVDPLTGMPVAAKMEQYQDKCPKHNTSFQMNRYCPDCKFEWHPQNYLSSNNGSPFWIDGFRTEDGVIRQWFFTEDECKGVAAQLIGKKRVHAIGIKFFLSKNPKPIMQSRRYAYAGNLESTFGGGPMMSCAPAAASANVYSATKCLASNVSDSSFRPARMRGPVKQLEIGAGAKIKQLINPDPETLDFWQPEPAGTLYINYCDVETANRILDGNKCEKASDGFLQGLKLKD